MLNKKVQFWRNILFLLDCLMLAWCWFLAYQLRFESGLVPMDYAQPKLAEYMRGLWLVPPVWFAVFSGLGLYTTRRRVSRKSEVLHLFGAAGLFALLLTSASWFAFKLSYSRLFLVGFWLMSGAVLVGLRIGFRELIRQLRRKGWTARNAVVLGTDELALDVHERLRQHPELGVRFLGFVTVHPQEVGAELADSSVIASVGELTALVRRERVDEVFVAQSAELEGHLDHVLRELGDELVDINLISDLCKHAMLGGRVEDFEGMPVLAVYRSPMVGWAMVGKRAFDFAMAAVGLVLTAPLILVAATLVKLTSRGPIFYAQERFGLDGERFIIHKMRTMVVDAERDGPVWGIANDPRVTPIGRFLRRTSVDELPQLWNVLKGEMSLVGPRPAQPVFVDRFKENIPRYMQRHRVKPGLTGWAQIHGQRGEGPADERLKYDLFYIRNWSMWLDVRIIWVTVWGGFLQRQG